MQNQFMPPETTAAPAISSVTEQTELQILESESRQTAARLALMKRKQQLHRRRYSAFLLCLLGSTSAFGVLTMLFVSSSTHYGFPIFLSFLLIFATFIGGMLMFLASAKPVMDTEELTRLGGVEIVGTLVKMWRSSVATQDKRVLTEVLTRLLPQLKASDANLLDASDRVMLNQHLSDIATFNQRLVRDYDFAVAILAAYEQIGNAADLPTVLRLAQMKTYTPDQKRVREAAVRCLPALEANQENAEYSRTLLRAAAPASATPDSLLRPAQFTPDPNSAQLLRPAASVKDGENG